jgi:DNA invertase Pin-like site-specific DNA recombinase
VSYHVEAGVSGATPIEQRAGLLAAIEDLGRHSAGRLVIARRDRLARDVVVAGLIERLVERAGARICAADGTGDGDGPEAVLLRSITDVFAMYERLVIGFRTRAALQAKKRLGQRVGQVPYGFRVGDDGRTLVPEDGEQRAIEIVHRVRATGISIRRVVGECERLGLVSRSGKPLGRAQVERILRVSSEAPPVWGWVKRVYLGLPQPSFS